jgi:hypothetical protein
VRRDQRSAPSAWRIAAAALMAGAGEARATAVLERIEVSTSPQVAVTLHLSGSTTPRAGHLTAPDRVFVDLPETLLAPDAPRAIGAGGSVLQVRTAQRDESTVRVVLDLARAAPYTVRARGPTVIVTLAAVPSDTTAAPVRPRAPHRSAERRRQGLYLDYPPDFLAPPRSTAKTRAAP